MKLLFLSLRNPLDQYQGGAQCTNRNYNSFCDLLGHNNVDYIDFSVNPSNSLMYKISKRLSLFILLYWGLTKKKLNHIISESYKYDYIFIDSSMYGSISYYLKKNKFKGIIICFFHNVELILRKENLFTNPLQYWEILIAYKNEKDAIKYSDRVISLNSRDAEMLSNIYSRRSIYIIPISLKDKNRNKDYNNSTSLPPTMLFIGSNYYANTHGITWFIENVLENVNIELQIIGNGMEILKTKYKRKNIQIFSYVEDLSEFIIKADFIISPIFKGSGMKVKTCEALMYGKNIIGTKESFEGYKIDPSMAGYECQTKEQFVKTINYLCKHKKNKFNQYSRQIFLDYYSYDSTLKSFENILQLDETGQIYQFQNLINR